MVKHTQTVRREFAELFDHFVKLALNGLNVQLRVKLRAVKISKILSKLLIKGQ